MSCSSWIKNPTPPPGNLPLSHLKFPLLAGQYGAASLQHHPPTSHLRHPAMPPSTCRAQGKSQKCPQNCFVQQPLAYPCRKNNVPLSLNATQNCCCRTRKGIHKTSTLVRLGGGGQGPILGWLSGGSCCTRPRSEGCSLQPRDALPPCRLRSSLQSHPNATANTNLCLFEEFGVRKPIKEVRKSLKEVPF